MSSHTIASSAILDAPADQVFATGHP